MLDLPTVDFGYAPRETLDRVTRWVVGIKGVVLKVDSKSYVTERASE